MATKHKINSMTLESGIVVNFKDDGMIELINKSDKVEKQEGIPNRTILIHTLDLDTIRLQAIKNSRIEAGNGVEIVNKEAVK